MVAHEERAASQELHTTAEQIRSDVEHLRRQYEAGIMKGESKRREQLQQVRKMVKENEAAWCAAMKADIGRPHFDCVNTSMSDIDTQARWQLDNLKKNMAPEYVPVVTQFKPYGRWHLQKEPYGVVLVISPWNFPLQLLLNPLLGALAAGNTVLLKPSEVAPNVAKLAGELVPKYLDSNVVRVVQGGVKETTVLLEQRSDKICYTGGTGVGKIVAAAAAKHLTPTLLELGGKCPAYVHSSANISVAARRIVWGKYLNCGQICLSPDYALVDQSVLQPLLDAIKTEITAQFGEDPQKSDSYARIINESHHDRLASYLSEDHGGEIVIGGRLDKADKYIAPTVILRPKADSKLLTEEIFGPILPVVPISGGIDEAVSYVNARETPLAAYAFTEDKAVRSKWIQDVAAGGMTINDVIGHFFNLNTPFGGKGASGTGAYRGPHSFTAFSHRKTVLVSYSQTDFILQLFRYAPYTDFREKLFSLMTSTDVRGAITALQVALAAAAVALFLKYVDVKVAWR